MPHIYAIGETVLDIIFENDVPVMACAGGSMLNSAVSLGRMELPVSMITGIGTDTPGRMANHFLKKNGVDNSMVQQDRNAKTTIALAFLDDQKKASYEFYQQEPAGQAEWPVPGFVPGDLLLFGSVFSLRPNMRTYITRTLEAAHQADVLTLYDPNFRTAHLQDLDTMKAAIFNNMRNASIVRGSDEDFAIICGLSEPDEVYASVSRYCENLVITRGADEVLVYASGMKKCYAVPALSAVSTIGAGDSFNAGLLYGLFHIKNKGLTPKLSEQEWDTITGIAIACASAVCMSPENYVPVHFKPAV
jgi:fructokinase